MKAFLLAAGLATRLRPITLNKPKCLVEVCGKPMLYWWIKLLKKHNIKDVIINVHHHSDQVIQFINKNSNDINFTIFHEKELLGSAGTLKANYDFVKNEKDFFIFYADNLTDYNLFEFMEFHKKNKKIFSMSLFKTDIPNEKGIVGLDLNNTVISFEEKPKNPKSNLANAGIYIAKPEIYNYIPEGLKLDIGFDLLPKLVKKSSGWISNDFLIDIGTIPQLKHANKIWKNNNLTINKYEKI